MSDEKSSPVLANKSIEEADVALTFAQRLPFFGGALGQCLIWTVIMSFLTFYWTNVLLIAPAVVSAFLLITKLWDAFNDPIVGYISDRTQTKLGRYRPWLWSFLPVAILGLLTFTKLPGVSDKAAGYFSLVMYFFYVLAYTCGEVPGQSLLAAVTTNFRSRGQVVTFRMCGSYASSFIIGSSFLPLVMALGDGTPVSEKGFFRATLLFTCIALPLGIYQLAGIKERVKIPVSKHKLRDSIAALKGNGPFWIFFVSFASYGITSGTTQARMYYWDVLYGDSSIMSANITSWMVGMALGSILYFFIVKKVKNKGFPPIPTFIATGIIMIGLYFYPMSPEATTSQLWIFHILTALGGVTQGVAVSGMYGCLPDITEYTQWKFHYRISGFISSILNCSYKWTLAIGVGVFVAVLGAVGYDPLAGAANTETVKTTINLFLHVVSGCAHIVAGLIMLRYKVDLKMLTEIREELAARTDEE